MKFSRYQMTGRLVTIFFLISNQVLLAQWRAPDEHEFEGEMPPEVAAISFTIGLVWSIKIQLDTGNPSIIWTLVLGLGIGGLLSFPILILFTIFS